MITWLRKNRIEIKYTLITLLMLGGMAALNWYGTLAGAEARVTLWMERLTEWGYVGLFIISLFANLTLIILLPYAIPLLTLSIYADSLWEVVGFGLAAGVGAGIGEIASYAVAHALIGQVNDLEQSAIFRWTRRTIERKPGVIPLLVWLASATPAPDVIIVLPLAMIQYPWRKMIVPMITGKIFQNVVMALVYRFAADYVESLLSEDISFDMTASFAIIFLVIIIYQIEKGRANSAAEGVDDASDVANEPTPQIAE